MATPKTNIIRSALHSDDDDSGDEEEMLLTQPVERPLAGVIAFVDVRLGRNKTINSGQSISDKLTGLGATVAPRVTKDVTHIVFKDGKTNLDKIENKSIFIVSPLWVESCNRCNEQVSEAKYPVVTKETHIGGDTPTTTPVVLGKIKRIKSMQPKPFGEEEISKSVERNRKRMAAISERDIRSLKRPSLRLDPFEFDEEKDSSSGTEESNTGPTTALRGSSSTPLVAHKKISKTHGKKKHKILRPHQQKAFIELNEADQGLTSSKTVAKRPSANHSHSKTVSRKSESSVAKENRSKEGDSDTEDLNEEDEEETPSKKLKIQPSAVKTEGYSSYTRSKRNRNSFEKKQPGIVITSLDAKDRETVLAVIDSLGGFEVSKSVEENTTHVICGAPRRTVNALAGTAKGCWLVSIDWVWNSLEARKWLPEGAFEMVSEFPAAQFFRLERQQAGLLYKPSLFHEAGSVYVSPDTKPAHQELEALLSIAGAKITGSRRKADVCVGKCQVPGENTVIVSEQWIIDSISEHQMLPIKDYALDTPGLFEHEASPEL